MYDPTYERLGRLIHHSYTLESGSRVRIEGEKIKRERTGVHATIAIRVNEIGYARSILNIDRDEDRVRLANSAHKQFGELDRACWPVGHLKKALDVFCEGLWREERSGSRAKGLAPEQGAAAIPLIERYVYRDMGTVLFSPPKRGKSFITLLLAVSIDAGVDTLWPSQRARCLFVNLERPERSLARRLARVNEALGLPWDRELLFIQGRGQSLTDVEDDIVEAIYEHKVEVVFVDSISRAGAGDLTENAPANRILDILNGLGVAYFAIGHTPRGDDSHLYGSQMFDAGADLLVRLVGQRRDGKSGVGLQMVEANDVAVVPQMELFALEFEGDGLENVRRAKDWEFPEIAADRQVSKEERARAYLTGVGEADAATVGEAIGMARHKASALLNNVSWAGRRRDGKKVIFYLLAEGHVGDT